MLVLPDAVKTWLDDSGWTPERNVAVPAHVPASHSAHEILRRFSGLTLVERHCEFGEPVTEFAFRSIDYAGQDIAQWTTLLRSQLIGVANMHNGHAELYMDENGRCFGKSLIHDAFFCCGESLGDTIESVLVGRQHRPLLRPNQSSVTLYGEIISRGDPRIYDY